LAELLTFLAKPPAVFAFFVYLFPFVWVFCYIGCIGTLARTTYSLGGYMAAGVPFETIFAIMMLGPIVFFAIMFCLSGWFRWRSPLVLLCWGLMWECSGLTQGAFKSMLSLYCGSQIKENISIIEKHSPDMYLPNRSDNWENRGVTFFLKTVNEPLICENAAPTFVCRMIVLTLGGAPLCYRVDKESGGGGILTFKKLDQEPVKYLPSSQTEGAINRSVHLSAEKMKELFPLVEAARQFYQQNKYSDPESYKRYGRMLLEFQVDGRYYFYSFMGESEQDRGPNSMPTPPFISKMRDLLAASAGPAILENKAPRQTNR
jgi:hypothetical protein